MNVHELPMVIFTLFSQMSVGTFITLGVVQFVASRRADEEHRPRRGDSDLDHALDPA